MAIRENIERIRKLLTSLELDLVKVSYPDTIPIKDHIVNMTEISSIAQIIICNLNRENSNE